MPRHTLWPVLVLLVWAALGEPATADSSPEEIRQRAATLLADPGFQTELPGVQNCAPGECTESTTTSNKRNRETFSGKPPARRRGRLEVPAPDGGRLARMALWVVVVVALATLVGSIAQEAGRHQRRRAAIQDAGIEPSTVAPPPPGTGDSIEALARSGRYAEAVHLLLVRVLGRISRPLGLAPSLTSREILKRPELARPESVHRREALAVLIETVERSWFGGQAVDRTAYERCLEASRRLRPTDGEAG